MDFLIDTWSFPVLFLTLVLRLQYTAAIRCLSCNDVIQPRHCSTFEQCPDGDSCVTESYQNMNGETLYNVGCMSLQRCLLTNSANYTRSNYLLRVQIVGTHVDHLCTECCHGDLCNAAGCGSQGFPQHRGPICLNCRQSRDPSYCDRLSVCLQGEVCHVEQINEFGDIFYQTSCLRETSHLCTSHPIYNPVEIGKRTVRRGNCLLCCREDFCNTKCHPSTSTVQPTTTTLTTATATHQSFKGTDFFLMFIENFKFSPPGFTLRAIVTFLETNANIQVTTTYNSTSFSASGPTKNIDINANMTIREKGKSSKGIILTFNTAVSVIAFNTFNDESSSMYLALPMEALGVSYIVGTYKPNTIDFPEIGQSFAVGAPYDNTVVNITLSTRRDRSWSVSQRDGKTITVVLDKLDTFYIETNTSDGDLTGTRIVSDKPVAVVSGNQCSDGPTGCNHIAEYLPPVSKWGSKFIVPPIRGSVRGVIRIIPSVNNTNITVLGKTLNKTYTLSNRYFIDIDTNSSSSYAIYADSPVLVFLIIVQDKTSMTLVPSTNQFSNIPVLISLPINTTRRYDNYIVVSIRSKDVSGLTLRDAYGAELARLGSVPSLDVSGEEYTFIAARCNNNQTCSVRHADKTVTFSVIVYGFSTYAEYAYPANLRL
ncbi:LOW QUALITY PROTEIN: IgGFc-binding protein-like [Pecten maximus]|uniref:LOW QUALITY PROTEIN: IgGFc-binding protein-like n=1 Tax=Pecten maximus TaxID=6579 RepID=UPI001458F88C|nr:LOW QUALITY PROTEIN: IgGFc-binding protein-like [Pecten maximus]